MDNRHAACMLAIFFVVRNGQAGIECDACRADSQSGDRRYQVGKVLFCGPCALLAADKIREIVRLHESERDGRQTQLELEKAPITE